MCKNRQNHEIKKVKKVFKKGAEDPEFCFCSQMKFDGEDITTKLISTIEKKIDKVMKNKVKFWYIGIASGENSNDALKRRYDSSKAKWGCNFTFSLVKVVSKEISGELERYFINYLKNQFPKKSQNKSSGNEGALSVQPYHYLYLAVRIWPKP